MTASLMSTWAWLRRCGLWLLTGMAIAWLIINLRAGPGVMVTDLSEAEGPEFSNPATLDLVSTVSRRRVCPSQTQRWVWRWTTYKGKRAQQAVPLDSTMMPFLADDGLFILTVSSAAVPDQQVGPWYYRTVTAETCGFMPTWLSGLFGPRVLRSPDVQVNFVGEPHSTPP